MSRQPKDTKKPSGFKAFGRKIGDLVHRKSSPRKNDSPAPPSPRKPDPPPPPPPATQPNLATRVSTSVAPSHGEPETSNAETLPPLASLPTKKPKETLLQRYPNAASFMKGSLEVAKILAEASAVPGLPLAVTAIQHLVEFAESLGEHRDQVFQLGEEAALYTKSLNRILKLRPSANFETEMDGVSKEVNVIFEELVNELLGELEKATATMNEITAGNSSLFDEVWSFSDIGEQIEKCTSGLKNARETFMIRNSALGGASNRVMLPMVTEILKINRQQEPIIYKWDLSCLPYVLAAYDQDGAIRTCHNDTRVVILEDIDDRLAASDARIVWLRASAGSGKSTIAKTKAERLQEKGWLAGSFFFSRNVPARAGMKDVFATVTSQFAARNEEFASALLHIINANPELRHAEPLKQLTELLIKPSNAIPPSSHPVVFVLDALDECGKDQGDGLVALLLAHISEFPSSFRFLVTSRPEAPLIDQLTSPGGVSVHTINIDETGRHGTSRSDIRTYLLAELRGYKRLNVLDEEIELLVGLADGLFQFAATAVRMIKSSSLNPRRTLNSILKIKQSGGENLSQRVTLNKLYGTVFQHAYYSHPDDDTQDYTGAYDESVRIHHLVIGGIVHVREPVSSATLAVLIDLPEDDVTSTLRPLSSVLLLPDSNDSNAPIRIRHLSFTEYITDPAGALSKQHPNLVIDNRIEANLVKGALAIMKEQLHFNISNSESSYKLNSAYPPSHFQAAIPPQLAYACRFWMSHLESVPQKTPAAVSLVMTFMDKNLLFWLEALSALGAVNIARAALEILDKWLEPIDPQTDDRLAPTKLLVKDAIKFTQYFAPVIAQSAPHTYLSTFPFAPTSSLVAQHYAPQFQNLVSLEIGQLADWPARRSVFHGHSREVTSVSFSPDGKRVASGSHDTAIRIWDVETGQTVVGPLEGHSSDVNSVAFSPDGRYLVSGLNDGTVRIWDAGTGQPVGGPFEGHSDWVESVAFSPDGTRIVSGSDDQTIRIWDVKTGMMVVGPFRGHSSFVMSVAFSPDGKLVVSGSWDETILVWDAETGQPVGEPFEGHSDVIRSVAFSPDGAQIVSGSDDKTIRLWDVKTGQTISTPFEGHSSPVLSVAFSPDGKLVVSGSHDNTLRIWDVATGHTVGQPFKGHSSYISSVAFSPDGTYVVSGSADQTVRIWDMNSDQTVEAPDTYHSSSIYSIAISPDGKHVVSCSTDHTARIWDAETGEMVVGPLEGHSNQVNSVAFSPDGQLVVSGSDDETVRIWDAKTGYAVGRPLEGHSAVILSVAFSPDSKLVVSGSKDKTIRVWDVDVGQTVVGPLEGHSGEVNSVAFSSDGKLVVSGSSDCTIRIWDVKTGQMVVGPFEGHTYHVMSVAFSPDGKLVAFGSADGTVRIWNVETGQAVGEPFEGHSDWIRSVAFSPDGTRIVSGSDDKTIRLWDVETGQMVAGPFEGHSGWVSSVAFSPDGKHVISGSWDNTIRILDPDASSGWPSFGDDITWHNDGWLRGPDNGLFLWVPPHYRQSFYLPKTIRVIGPYETRVDSRNGIWGKEWTRCHVSDVVQ